MKAIKVLSESVIGISGLIGALSVDGVTEMNQSIYPVLIAFGISIVGAITLAMVTKYERWKTAEYERQKKVVSKRIARMSNVASRLSGMPS